MQHCITLDRICTVLLEVCYDSSIPLPLPPLPVGSWRRLMRIWETLWPSSMVAHSWCIASRPTARWRPWQRMAETFTRPYTGTTGTPSQVSSQGKVLSQDLLEPFLIVTVSLGVIVEWLQYHGNGSHFVGRAKYKFSESGQQNGCHGKCSLA